MSRKKSKMRYDSVRASSSACPQTRLEHAFARRRAFTCCCCIAQSTKNPDASMGPNIDARRNYQEAMNVDSSPEVGK